MRSTAFLPRVSSGKSQHGLNLDWSTSILCYHTSLYIHCGVAVSGACVHAQSLSRIMGAGTEVSVNSLESIHSYKSPAESGVDLTVSGKEINSRKILRFMAQQYGLGPCKDYSM